MGRRWTCGGAVVAGALSLLLVSPVRADPPVPGSPGELGGNKSVSVAISRVESGPGGVVIHITASENLPGSSTGPSSSAHASGASGPSCSASPVNIGNASVSWFQSGAAAHPGQTPYALSCDGAFQGIVWLPTSTDPGTVRVAVDPGGSVDPVGLAESILKGIPLPPITLGMNPGTGLVALPSWFWVDGYDGTPITASASLGGVTVMVQLTPEGYRWRFGDGAELSTMSLGRRYPQQSDLAHTYEQSSLRAGGAYAVALTVTFRVTFQIVGGGTGELAPITRTYTAAYPVQQAQSVLTGR